MDTPYTLLQFRIAHALLERIKTKVKKLKAVHDDQVDTLYERIKACTSEKEAKKLQIEWEALHERGRRITLHNVVRVAVELGLDEMDTRDTLDKIAEEGTPLGRPRRIAQ